MEQIRTFIAIELPDELKLRLTKLQARLKNPSQPWVKWVNPDGIHLTLKFLGNISADRTDDITAAMSEAAGGISPFKLTMGGLGAFPNLKRVQVFWTGIGGDIDKLSRLKQQLDHSLARQGFDAETRPFSAHLTLARLHRQASPAERQEFGRLITDIEFPETAPFKVTAINLIKSQLTPRRAIYSLISSVKLKVT